MLRIQDMPPFWKFLPKNRFSSDLLTCFLVFEQVLVIYKHLLLTDLLCNKATAMMNPRANYNVKEYFKTSLNHHHNILITIVLH